MFVKLGVVPIGTEVLMPDAYTYIISVDFFPRRSRFSERTWLGRRSI